MAEPPTTEQTETPRGGLFVTATWLLAWGVALLPLWDSLRSPVLIVVALVAAAVFLVSFLRVNRLRWVVVGTGILFIVGYSIFASGSDLSERSRQVDRLPTCETGELPPGVTERPATTMGGPRTKAGEPCARLDENRDDHRRWSPDGDLADGFHQVLFRFPGDEFRMLFGPMIALCLMACGGVVLAKVPGAIRS